MEQAGFTLVKALGVEGIGQPVEFIIQVVAELVEKCAQKGLERHDAAVFGRAHPECDYRRRPSFSRFVQPVQLTP